MNSSLFKYLYCGYQLYMAFFPSLFSPRLLRSKLLSGSIHLQLMQILELQKVFHLDHSNGHQWGCFASFPSQILILKTLFRKKRDNKNNEKCVFVESPLNWMCLEINGMLSNSAGFFPLQREMKTHGFL